MEIVKGKGKVLSLQEKEKQKAELYEMLDHLPAPPAQASLTQDQVVWWYWFGNELVKTGKVAKLDLVHLQKAAFWLDARNKAMKKINQKNEDTPGMLRGMVQVYNTGASNISPEVSIVEKADKAIAEISAHFGLSIRDRNKIGAVAQGDPGQTSLFEEFMNLKKTS